KRPEDRFQTGQEFDRAMSLVAAEIFPGWEHSLEPCADLSRMVPNTTPPNALPATPIGIAISQPAAAMPQPHVVYNPTPPGKPVAKTSMSCLTLVGSLVFMSA